jgi:hypothetical protein
MLRRFAALAAPPMGETGRFALSFAQNLMLLEHVMQFQSPKPMLMRKLGKSPLF